MMQRMLNKKATKPFFFRALCAGRPSQGYKQVHHIVDAPKEEAKVSTRPYPWEGWDPDSKRRFKNALTYFSAKEIEFEVKMEMLDHLKPDGDSKYNEATMVPHPKSYLATGCIKYPGGPRDEEMVYLADIWHLFILCDEHYALFELPKQWYCSQLAYIQDSLHALQIGSSEFLKGEAVDMMTDIDVDAAAIKACIDDAEPWIPFKSHKDVPQEVKAIAKKWVDKVDMMRKARGIPLLPERAIHCPC